MAFPTVSAISENQDASPTTTHPVVIPAALEPGSVLLFIEFCSHNQNFQGHPPGFQILGANPTPTSGNINIVIRGFQYLSALLPVLGVERFRPIIPGGTLILTTTAARKGVVYAVVFAEKEISFSYFKFANSSGGGSPIDPPNLVYSGVAKDVLWWAMGVGGGFDFGGYPTNYTLYQENGEVDVAAPFGGFGDCAIAARELNATSENPGVFTGTGPSSDWYGLTMGVALDGP